MSLLYNFGSYFNCVSSYFLALHPSCSLAKVYLTQTNPITVLIKHLLINHHTSFYIMLSYSVLSHITFSFGSICGYTTYNTPLPWQSFFWLTVQLKCHFYPLWSHSLHTSSRLRHTLNSTADTLCKCPSCSFNNVVWGNVAQLFSPIGFCVSWGLDWYLLLS